MKLIQNICNLSGLIASQPKGKRSVNSSLTFRSIPNISTTNSTIRNLRKFFSSQRTTLNWPYGDPEKSMSATKDDSLSRVVTVEKASLTNKPLHSLSSDNKRVSSYNIPNNRYPLQRKRKEKLLSRECTSIMETLFSEHKNAFSLSSPKGKTLAKNSWTSLQSQKSQSHFINDNNSRIMENNDKNAILFISSYFSNLSSNASDSQKFASLPISSLRTRTKISDQIISSGAKPHNNNSMSFIISKPTFKHSYHKVTIELFYYCWKTTSLKRSILNTLKGGYTLRENASLSANGKGKIVSRFPNSGTPKRSAQRETTHKMNRFIYGCEEQSHPSDARSMASKTMGIRFNSTIISNVINYLSELYGSGASGSKKKEVSLVVTRLYYPYIDSFIFAQYLAYNASTKNFLNFKRSIFSKATKAFHNSDLPSHITGIKVQLSGRLKTEPEIPRITVKSMIIGSFSTNSDGPSNSKLLSLANYHNQVIDYSRFTTKNNIGAFTIKV